MIYTVITRLSDGTKVLGRPRPSLKAAESLAMFRAASLPSDAATIILDHMCNVAGTYPGQLVSDGIIDPSVKTATNVAANRGRATRTTVDKKRRARKRNR